MASKHALEQKTKKCWVIGENAILAIFFTVTQMPRLMKIKEEHKSFLTWNQEEQFLEMGKAIPWFQLWATVAN